METREVQSDHITVLYPSTATKDSYGLVLVRGSKMRTLGVINSTVGVMPDENLRNALSALFPDIFKGEKISSSAKYVTFTDGTLISAIKISLLWRDSNISATFGN